jgi:hypothetical protein
MLKRLEHFLSQREWLLWFYSIALCAFLGFVSLEIYSREAIQICGVITEAQKKCDSDNVYRCSTRYTFDPLLSYIAECNDHSLSRELKPGDFICKKRGALTYTVNGSIINDFPLTFYRILQSIFLSALLFFLFLAYRVHNKRET